MKNIIISNTISNNETETQLIGFDIAKEFYKGDIILLNGDMGAGKTSFVKGVAKQKNVAQDVVSPTFTIINEYAGDIDIYHMDLYRLDKPEELFEIGFEEYLYSRGIVMIEWPDIAMSILKNFDYKQITIKKTMPHIREIKYEIYDLNGD
jgi:tRNA threonylcarbamoyladenosine biosynthesis protein TsaE